MGMLASFFRWLSGGARSAPAAAPAPPDVPLGELESVKDRVAEAIGARGDLDAQTKANAMANIKGLYYMMLAARDLARSDDPETAAQVRMLLERAASGMATFLRDLRGLGDDGNNLARGLEAAFDACRGAIAARLRSQAG